jgi:hypothetical protein
MANQSDQISETDLWKGHDRCYPVPGFKVVADISSTHIADTDAQLLRDRGHHACCIGTYEYGYFVSTHYADDAEGMKRLSDEGFSAALIDILHKLYINNIFYVAFDSDGYTVEGWQEFNW